MEKPNQISSWHVHTICYILLAHSRVLQQRPLTPAFWQLKISIHFGLLARVWSAWSFRKKKQTHLRISSLTLICLARVVFLPLFTWLKVSSWAPLKASKTNVSWILTCHSNLIFWVLGVWSATSNCCISWLNSQSFNASSHLLGCCTTKDDDYDREWHRCTRRTALATRKLLRYLAIDCTLGARGFSCAVSGFESSKWPARKASGPERDPFDSAESITTPLIPKHPESDVLLNGSLEMSNVSNALIG